MLAALLPFMPFLRSFLPVIESSGSPNGAILLRWAVGIAICGYDAISKASSVAISPASATIGSNYSGTITYSGGHAGSVSSMNVNGACLGSTTVAGGLTITYNGVNTAKVTGIPTTGFPSVGLNVVVYDGSGCGGGLSDSRSTSLIIQSSGGGPVAPSMLTVPQNTLAQVGSDVILSGGASGNPTPTYTWKLGAALIPGATQNTYTIPAASLSAGGVYTLVASNSQGVTNAACYLTMALTPGSNILAFLYTNFVVAGPVTMSSMISNVPSGVNTYSWQWNNGDLGVTTSNLSFTATPAKSGTYSVTFNSTVGSSTVAHQQYNSYWVFGYPPTIPSTNEPASQSVNAGANVTFSSTMGGGNYASVFLYQNGTNLVAQTNYPNYNPASTAFTTNFSFVISNVSQANAGTYTIVATNFWGSTTSSNAVLTVTSPLSVTNPQGQTNYAGKNVSLTATASGTGPFNYQWQQGGANIFNGGSLSGVNTNTLLIAPAATTNSGNYRVVVTNNSGGSVTSGVAVVSIVPVPQLNASLSGSNLNLSASGGVVGSNYVVELSTNLAVPNGWTPIGTNVVGGDGSINFADTNAPGAQGRFFRLEFP